MGKSRYNRVTVRHLEEGFSIYCTQHSLEYRRDEVIMWADGLARKLGWLDYELDISPTTEKQANERAHALFENRFPDR